MAPVQSRPVRTDPRDLEQGNFSWLYNLPDNYLDAWEVNYFPHRKKAIFTTIQRVVVPRAMSPQAPKPEEPEEHPGTEPVVATPKPTSDSENLREASTCPTPSPDSGKPSSPASHRKRSPFNKKRREKKKKDKAAQAAAAIIGTSSPGKTEDPLPLTSDKPIVDTTDARPETPAPCTVPEAVTVEVKADSKESTGPCIVDTEKWRKRRLEALAAEQEAEAKKAQQEEVDAFTCLSADDAVTSHEIRQSESAPAVLEHPREEQSYPPFHRFAPPVWHYQTICGFYPACIVHSEWDASRVASGQSCCCAHGSYDCRHPIPPPMFYGNMHPPAPYGSPPPPYQMYPPSFGPGQPGQMHMHRQQMSESAVTSSSTPSQTVPPSVSASENENLRALLRNWEDAKLPDEVTPAASTAGYARPSPSPPSPMSPTDKKSVAHTSAPSTDKKAPEVLRPVRFAEDIERELHEKSGVKSPEGPASNELSSSVVSLFEISRLTKLSTSSSPKPATSKGPVPTVSSPVELSRHSVSSSPPDSSISPLPIHLSHDSAELRIPVEGGNPDAVQQEVPAEKALADIGIPADNLQSPTTYWDAKQTMSSSPPGSLPSNEPIHGTCLSVSSGGTPVSKTIENATTASSSGDSNSLNGQKKVMPTHVKSLFGCPEFSDIQILLGPETPLGGPPIPVTFYVHKNIIAASPYLYEIMQTQLSRTGVSYCIHIFTGPSFTSAHAFGTALQHFYGQPLIDLRTIHKLTLQGLGYPDDDSQTTYPFNLERAKTDFALSYAASGAFLGCRSITERGIQLAVELLSWETVETLVNFGMTVNNFMISSPDIAISCASSGDSPSHSPNYYQMEQIHQLKYMWSDLAINAGMQFIADNMSPNFELYRRAQAKFTPTRIPNILHTLPGSCCANPKLESLQFGDIPSFASMRPTRLDILIPSALLITLPFQPLMLALDTMKARGVLTVAMMKDIVEEREARRMSALRMFLRHRHWQREEIGNHAIAELAYREFLSVERARPGEDENAVTLCATVQREWVGFKMPNEELLVPTGSSGRV
ncbi:uncharacterized protein N7459_009190 [Penicillium hispanicum]|uniref:uncharacterized protein n=1 Tax=Penicillium hispanicum TaxID=1080232 RepID=UPI002540DA15|nr:uncharacterized protein N7459_009190 [Penicillium hispanicum]KAJ5569760.1 hypothetical protein N7459_009190 [Penicillium hispanicum]